MPFSQRPIITMLQWKNSLCLVARVLCLFHPLYTTHPESIGNQPVDFCKQDTPFPQRLGEKTLYTPGYKTPVDMHATHPLRGKLQPWKKGTTD